MAMHNVYIFSDNDLPDNLSEEEYVAETWLIGWESVERHVVAFHAICEVSHSDTLIPVDARHHHYFMPSFKQALS